MAEIVVAGLGRFGSNAAETLFQQGHDVLAIDRSQERVDAMVGRVTYSVAGDTTDETFMRELGVPSYNIAIVAIGRNVEASVMTSVLLASFEIRLVVARANGSLHENTLTRIGCDRVVNVEEEAGVRLADTLFNPNVEEYISLGASLGISKMPIPRRFNSMTLADAGFSTVRDIGAPSALALLKGDNARLMPSLDEIINDGDGIVVVGDKDRVDTLTR